MLTVASSVKGRIEQRVQWAHDHIKNAKGILDAFQQHGSYRVESQRDVQTGYYSFRLVAVKPIPPQLGLVFADAIHNLRASLDNTIWALHDPTVTDPHVLRHVSFMLADDDHAWRSWVGRVKAVLAKDVLDDLHDLQPHLGLNPVRSAFATLDWLWNDTKHRTPTFGLTHQTTMANLVLRQGNMELVLRDGPFDEGDEIAEGRPIPDGSEPEFEAHFRLQVALEKGTTSSGLPVQVVLVELHRIVRDDILPRFLGRL